MAASATAAIPSTPPLAAVSDGSAPVPVFQWIQEQFARDVFYSSSIGDLAAVKLSVEGNEEKQVKKVNIDSVDASGNTAIHWAAYRNHAAVVEYLLSNGANPEIANKEDGQTPLHWACIAGHTACVRLLLKQGNVNPLSTDKHGYNAFHTLAMYGHLNLLHYAVLHFLQAKPNQTLAQALDIRDNKGHTPLAWAAYKGHASVALYLINQGADIKVADSGGMTALHWAAQRGHRTVVDILVRRGAEITAKDGMQFTPEQHAQKKNHLEIAAFLALSQVQPMTRAELGSKQNQMVWFGLPIAFVCWAALLVTQLPGWLSVLLLVGTVFAIRFVFLQYWPGQETKNTFWFGWFYATYAVTAVYYFWGILPDTISHTFQHVLFISLGFTLIGLHSWLAFGNPGHLAKPKEDEEKAFCGAMETNKPGLKLCATCLVRQPLRSKHCRSCDKCVAKFDHHSSWLNNCVGADNHWAYLAVLTLVTVCHLFVVVMTYNGLLDLPNAPATMLSILWHMGWYFNKDPIGVLVFWAHLAQLGWQGYVLYLQLNNLTMALTYNERINYKKYKYLFSNDSFHNPFSKGDAVANVLAYAKQDAAEWHNLYSLSSQQQAPIALGGV